jgi:pyruvate formate lyase activating enzyme
VRVEVDELVDAVTPAVRCVCFFGGDPTPQLGVLMTFAEELRRLRPDVRVCFETNGSASRVGFTEMLELSLAHR